MKEVRVIIISSNESLRDFFMLEAMSFDFKVDCYSKFEKSLNDISNYDIAVIDIDTVKQRPLNTAKKQITVSVNSKVADISYPISVIDLRRIYTQALLGDIPTKSENDEKNLKIIFYKNEKNIVSYKNKKYILSDWEYNLLRLLCENANEAVSRNEISRIFGTGESNIADVYICKLRKKLEEPQIQRLIYTVRSRGYKIITEMEWR